MSIRLPAWEESILQKIKVSQADQSQSWNIKCFDEVDSTMDVARAMARKLLAEQAGLVLTRSQRLGRGRQGRSWEASAGAFYATYIFHHAKLPVSMSGFSLVIGYALHDFFSSLNCAVGLKWPNDILAIDGRKLCGVLVEVLSEGNTHIVLSGIGINLKEVPPEVDNCVSVYELTGKLYEPAQIAAEFSPRFLSVWRRFLDKGFVEFREQWLKSALYLNHELAIQNGDQKVKGKFCGIGEGGELLLEVAGKVQRFASGHIVEIE